MKDKLMSMPVLNICRQNALTELHTDASQKGFGAILMPRVPSGKLHPIYYMSRKTLPSDEKMHSYFLEVKAVHIAFIKFSIYLLGIHFKLVTDCQAMVLIMKKNDLPAAVFRWILIFQEFSFDIEH